MKTLVIVHGGQTGVDRGAHDAAIDCKWPLYGYMPKNGMDELGAIPPEVATHLQYCTVDGLSARTRVNIDLASCLLVVVQDRQDPYATPGTRLTLQYARESRRRRNPLPTAVIDPGERPVDLANWVRSQLVNPLYKTDFVRMMVAGPRESRWADGRHQTAGLLRAMNLQLHKED